MASGTFQKNHHIKGKQLRIAPSWQNLCFCLVSALVVLTIAWLSAETITLSPGLAYTIAFVIVATSILGCAFSSPNPRISAAISTAILAIAALGALKFYPDLVSAFGQACVVTVTLLSAGSLIGAFVGYRIEAPGHLLIVVVVSSLVDLLSVVHPAGPSAQLAQDKAMLSLLALPWPMLGTKDLIPVIGVGDIVFSALYVAASRAHALSAQRTLFALIAGFAFTLLALFVFMKPIPALPFFGAAMLIAHPRARVLPTTDRKKALLGFVILAAALAFWLLRH